MGDITTSLPLISYGLAGVAFLLLTVLLLTSYRGRLRGGLLTIAALVTAAWAALHVWALGVGGLSPAGFLIVEFLLDAAWLVFLTALLSGAVAAARYWIVRYSGFILVAVLIAIGFTQEWNRAFHGDPAGSDGTLVLGSLLTSLYALVLIEQIYRNARASQRDGLKYLCLGMSVIFAYDLFLYSNAILNGQLSGLFWGVRGFVVAMSVPLIAIAAQRSPAWSVGIFVSRQVVFYTTTLLGAGVYLLLVGLAGYYFREVGGEWGAAAQVILSAAAVVALFVFLFSDTMRRRIRVFISKHFFANKYDYREEWLRLIDTLTSVEESLPLKKRGVKALAEILDAPSGLLWLRSQDSGIYECVAGWNTNRVEGSISAEADLPVFMHSSGWVVDIAEYEADTSIYQDVDLSVDVLVEKDAAYVIPLLHDAELLGFVVLSEPPSRTELNFEDRDLLKTAGQQIASYLAQEMSTEQLAEGRQFEAFSRLTAYLMHDLKNVIAQQSLVVENADKHKDNPEFIDDAISTIKGSVARMRNVIEHLQQTTSGQNRERVELSKLVSKSVEQCSDRRPAPSARICDEQVWVRADPDRLLMALNHAIRNAQDAAAAGGEVNVSLSTNGATCSIEIADTGEGMDSAFVRDRLFKPFDSTKGTQGMGIGAYQIRETLRSMGGSVDVDSNPGVGTRLTMSLQVLGDKR